jgi:carboxyl-terminal processing protease
MKRITVPLLASALSVALSTAFAAHAAPAAATTADPKSKDTFAVVWERLQNSGFKGEHEGLDWAALKAEHQPEIEASANIKQLRKEINELLEDLKASHFALIPSEAMPESGKAAPPGLADTGLRFALAGKQLLVERVLPGSPAEKAGIRAGWSVDAIDDTDIAAALKALVELDGNARRQGEAILLSRANKQAMGIAAETRVALRLRDAAGKPRALDVAAAADPALQSVTLPGLPPMPLRIAYHRIDRTGAGCTLHFEFNQWAMPVYEELSDALREHPGCDGVVLDLRGNSGGLVPSLTAVSGLFFEKPTSLGTMTLGDGQSLQLMALPRQVSDDGREIRRHTGKLAILTDRGSISCSDIFPASLQAVGRARIFGSTSAGMALPAAAVPLPSGDRLMYPTADFVDPLKRRIEGVGVVPDQPVVPSPASLAKGGDPVLDAAVAWLGSGA